MKLLGKRDRLHCCFCGVVAGVVTSVFVSSVFLLRWQRKTSTEEFSLGCRDLPREAADKKQVYFLETSGKGNLSLRQMAAVESAARFLLDSAVTVMIFPEEGILMTPAMQEVATEYQVNFTVASMPELFRGTPLGGWYERGEWRDSPYWVAHLSDALRLLVLWLHGGVYLDLDVLMTRNWTFPDNCLVTEDELGVANTLMAFRRHHPLLLACLKDFALNYDPNDFPANGPYVIRRVLKSVRHSDVSFLPASSFFEIRYEESHKHFEEQYRDEVLGRTSDVVGVHVWNSVNKGMKINTTTDCSYVRIVNKTSPITFKFMTEAESI